jgi:hypothetical protein
MTGRPRSEERPEGRKALGSALTGLTVALVGVLALPACGGSGGDAASTVSQPPAKLHDAITAPRATELRPGMSVRVRKSVLRTVGWQVACSMKGKRVNAEAIRGQVTGAGELTSFEGGTPSIWVKHNGDGSITVSCR